MAVVQDNLGVHFNVADKASYPGSGDTIYDIAPPSNKPAPTQVVNVLADPTSTQWIENRWNVTEVTGQVAPPAGLPNSKIWKIEFVPAYPTGFLQRIPGGTWKANFPEFNPPPMGMGFWRYSFWIRGDLGNSSTIRMASDISDGTTSGYIDIGTNTDWVEISLHDNLMGRHNADEFFDLSPNLGTLTDVLYITTPMGYCYYDGENSWLPPVEDLGATVIESLELLEVSTPETTYNGTIVGGTYKNGYIEFNDLTSYIDIDNYIVFDPGKSIEVVFYSDQLTAGTVMELLGIKSGLYDRKLLLEDSYILIPGTYQYYTPEQRYYEITDFNYAPSTPLHRRVTQLVLVMQEDMSVDAYINGRLVSSGNFPNVSNLYNSMGFDRIFNSATDNRTVTGGFQALRYYTKALSAIEVFQNFSTLIINNKRRYTVEAEKELITQHISNEYITKSIPSREYTTEENRTYDVHSS